MIYDYAPRKGYTSYHVDPNEGFFIEGNNYDECLKELSSYAESHKEKWIYFYNMGLGPAYPVPVAKNIFDVRIFDAKPACIMLFYNHFQSGSENRHEFDEMTKDQQNEFLKKQLNFFYTLGSMFERERNKK